MSGIQHDRVSGNGKIIDAKVVSSTRVPPRGLGEFDLERLAATGDLTSVLPDSVRPHVVLVTPAGTTIIDPMIQADPGTQATLANLGIQMYVFFGPVPEEFVQQAQSAPLGRNLALLGVAALGVLLLLNRK